MAKKNKPASVRYRSAETGQYVSADFAKKHPKTTVAERTKKRKRTIIISNIVG